MAKTQEEIEEERLIPALKKVHLYSDEYTESDYLKDLIKERDEKNELVEKKYRNLSSDSADFSIEKTDERIKDLLELDVERKYVTNLDDMIEEERKKCAEIIMFDERLFENVDLDLDRLYELFEGYRDKIMSESNFELFNWFYISKRKIDDFPYVDKNIMEILNALSKEMENEEEEIQNKISELLDQFSNKKMIELLNQFSDRFLSGFDNSDKNKKIKDLRNNLVEAASITSLLITNDVNEDLKKYTFVLANKSSPKINFYVAKPYFLRRNIKDFDIDSEHKYFFTHSRNMPNLFLDPPKLMGLYISNHDMLKSENEPDCFSEDPSRRLSKSDWNFWEDPYLVSEWFREYNGMSFPNYLLEEMMGNLRQIEIDEDYDIEYAEIIKLNTAIKIDVSKSICGNYKVYKIYDFLDKWDLNGPIKKYQIFGLSSKAIIDELGKEQDELGKEQDEIVEKQSNVDIIFTKDFIDFIKKDYNGVISEAIIWKNFAPFLKIKIEQEVSKKEIDDQKKYDAQFFLFPFFKIPIADFQKIKSRIYRILIESLEKIKFQVDGLNYRIIRLKKERKYVFQKLD